MRFVIGLRFVVGLRFVIALLLCAGCVHRVPIAPIPVDAGSLVVGDTDFAQLLTAADGVVLRASATLREGRYRMPGDDYLAMVVQPGTVLEVDASFGLSMEQRGLRPRTRRFTVRFSRSVELIGTDRRVTVRGAELREGEGENVRVDVAMGRTIARSLAQAVTGVPAGLEEAPELLDVFDEIDGELVQLSLRTGAELLHGQSRLVLGPASVVRLTRVEVNVPDRSARLDIDGALKLDPASCVENAGLRLCGGGEFFLIGQYTRRLESGVPRSRLSLTTPDRPTRFDLREAQLQGDELQLEVPRAELKLGQLDCGGPDERWVCRFAAEASLDAGPGNLALVDGASVAFEGAELRGVRYASESEGEGARFALQQLLFRRPALSAGALTMAFETLALQDLSADRWAELGGAAASLAAGPGVVRVGLGEGETTIEGRLPNGATVNLVESREGMLIDSVLERVQLRAGDVSASAPRLHLQVRAQDASHVQASLSAPDDARVDGEGAIAFSDVRMAFDALELSLDGERLELRTRGLALSIPEAEALRLLSPRVPPAFASDEQPLTGRVASTLETITGAIPFRDLSRFRVAMSGELTDPLQLSFERGALRARGELNVLARLLADEERVSFAMCEEEVQTEMALPCFEGMVPSLCTRSVSATVPYPCMEREEGVATLYEQPARLRLDLSASITSNAPTTLGELELASEVRNCRRLEVAGIPASLQRAVGVRDLVCDGLRDAAPRVRLSELVPAIGESRDLANARVQRFRLDSDGERLRLDLELAVALGQPREAAEALGTARLPSAESSGVPPAE
ncbi:MAG: hypothetical protein AAF411_14240 [Myxococcota bacterium]